MVAKMIDLVLRARQGWSRAELFDAPTISTWALES